MCLVGDGAVGKTSLRYRYLGKGFKSTYIMTVGADFSVMEEIFDGIQFRFQIWDLAGQREYETLTNLYYKGSKGFLLVYDVTRTSSYENILNWAKKIMEHVDEDNVHAILIANKIDLRENPQFNCITKENGKKLAKMLSKKLSDGLFPVSYIETSAKTGENVLIGFRKLSEQIYKTVI